MKALLITADTQSIEAVEISDIEDIRRLIGFPTLESDTLGDDGDHLYFDEECFIRGSSGRFQIDRLIPVAGKGVVIGHDADGQLRDVRMSADDLRTRTSFQ
jgi:hypothetical protein